MNHPENEQDGVEEEEDLEEPPKSEDDSYVDSKAEVVFTILNTFNKKDYEGEKFSLRTVRVLSRIDVGFGCWSQKWTKTFRTPRSQSCHQHPESPL